VCNSPEDTVDYWGELIRKSVRLGAGVFLRGERGYKVLHREERKRTQSSGNLTSLYTLSQRTKTQDQVRDYYIKKNRIERDRNR